MPPETGFYIDITLDEKEGKDYSGSMEVDVEGWMNWCTEYKSGTIFMAINRTSDSKFDLKVMKTANPEAQKYSGNWVSAKAGVGVGVWPTEADKAMWQLQGDRLVCMSWASAGNAVAIDKTKIRLVCDNSKPIYKVKLRPA